MKTRSCVLLLTVLCMCFAAVSADGYTQTGGGTVVSAPGTGAVPTGWNTQETNENPSGMLDGNRNTTYQHVCWTSKSKDFTPEITFYFNNAPMKELWIRNGDQSSYSAYYASARIKKMSVTIYQSDGTTARYQYQLQDTYDTNTVSQDWNDGYQRLALPQAYSNVTRVDLWIQGWYLGGTNTYTVRVSDLVFLTEPAQNPAPGTYDPGTYSPGTYVPQTPQPSQGSPNDGWYGYYPQVTLNQRMATRSGPGTQYTELGSYFKSGTTVTAISAAYDDRNGIWWIQTEFTYRGELRRAYTGLKRLNMSVSDVSAEYVMVQSATVNRSVYAYWGPGYNYTMYKDPIPAGTEGTVWQMENGYAQLEFYDYTAGLTRRVWIPFSALEFSYG